MRVHGKRGLDLLAIGQQLFWRRGVLEAIGHLIAEADLIAVRQRSDLPELDPRAADADVVLVDAVELIRDASDHRERNQAVASQRLQLRAYGHPVQGGQISSIANSDLARPLGPAPVAKVDAIDRAAGCVPADNVEHRFLNPVLQRNERDLVGRTGGRHSRQSCGGLQLGEADPACVEVEDQVGPAQARECIVERLG